jgi:hypothetical protein
VATIEEAKTAIVATAQRMARSIAYSREHLTGAALETAASIFTTANLWALCILFAGWVIGTVVSGPIGIAANALLVAWGLYSSYEILTELFKNGKEWAVLCYEAKSEGDLKVAGAVFAKLFVGGLADILQVVILHRTFRALRSKINNKIPPPAEVEGFKKGEAKSAPKTESKPETAKAEKPKPDEAKAEKPKDEAAKDKALTERAKEASDTAKESLKDAVVDGAAAVAPSHTGGGSILPALALVGGVLVVGGTAALVASRSGR